MTDDGHARARRLSAVIAASRRPQPAEAMCHAAIGALDVAGAGLTLMQDGVVAPLAWSGGASQRLEGLQQTLGEGPSPDAHRTGTPVMEPHLAAPRRPRWVAFSPAAISEGAAALFSFPLRVGAVRLGALTLYRARPGELSAEQHTDARAVADLAVAAILRTQAGEADGRLSPGLEELMTYSATMHQASGMVSAQLGIGVGEALARLRAHAFATGRPLTDVAADIVARRLRLGER